MPIFATPRYENNDDVDILHELEATPAGSKPQDDDNDSGGDNPADAPEDYTLDDEGEDQTPEEGDQNAPDEGTEADNQAADDGDDVGSGDSGADSQADTSDEGGGGDGEMGGDGGEAEGGDDSFGDGDGDEDGEGEGGDDGDTDDYTSDSGDGEEDELKKLEDEIFANYSPEQRSIMSKALKKRFNKVIEMSADLLDRINEIPKSMEHIKTIEFVTDKIDEIQRMISDYLYYTFDTKTYTENERFFERLMITYNQISDLVGKIPSITVSKPAT